MLSIKTSLKGVFLFTIILCMLSWTYTTILLHEPKNDLSTTFIDDLSTTFIDHEQKSPKDFQRWKEEDYSWSHWSKEHTVILQNLSLPKWNSTDEGLRIKNNEL